MPDQSSQQFLRDLDKSRAERDRPDRTPARRVRAAASVNFVSDSFAVWQAEIEAQLRDPESLRPFPSADPHRRYGTPPRRRRGIPGAGRRASKRGNANFAWIQHMLHHLAPQSSMALLLANGSMSSGSGGRRAVIEADLV